MSGEPVPKLDVVTAFEQELARTGAVVLTPSPARVIGAHAPSLLALVFGVWLAFQPVQDSGVARWVPTFLLIATGLYGVWQVFLGLFGRGRHPIRVTADGLHDDATGGRLAWHDITGVEVDERTLRGITISRWVRLVVHPAAAREWAGTETGSALGGFVGDLREDMDNRLGGASRLELPASLPEPSSVRKWLADEVSRRGQR